MLASQLSAHSQPSGHPTSQSETTAKNIDSLLPKVQQKILKNLGYSPVSINQLQERTGLSIAEINANLVLLEIHATALSLKPDVRAHAAWILTLKLSGSSGAWK